jgi:uncharacterized surface anchored protein
MKLIGLLITSIVLWAQGAAPPEAKTTEVKGKIVFRGGALPSGLEIGLEPLPPKSIALLEDTTLILAINDQPMPPRPADATVDASGTFAISSVSKGRYDLTFSANSENYYISEIRAGGKLLGLRPQLRRSAKDSRGRMTDVYAILFEVESAPPQLEIFVNLRGTVEVTVQDSAKKTVGGAMVALIPNAPYRGVAAYYKTGAADKNGKITFHSVVPGDYVVFAADGWRLDEMMGDAFLITGAQYGRPAAVDENTTVQVTAPPVPKANSTEEKKP